MFTNTDSENTLKESMRTWKRCIKTVGVLAYSPEKLRDTKLSISQLIMMQHEICFDPYFLYKMGWIKQTSAGKDKASFSLLTNPWEKI
jgi:hypothetical protein